jgi:N-acetylmuramoyl-L-alanine amidase
VECGFLTSETEARKIATPAYRQQIAEALAGGVRDYVTAARGAKPAAPALVATTGGRAQPGAR